MKIVFFTLLCALSTLTICNAQQIEMEKVLGGYKYTQNGKQMKMNDLYRTMWSNQQAFGLIRKAKSNYTVASIFGGAGGFLVGWPIGTALGGGDANWTLAGIGLGLFAISIPFSLGVNENVKQAVEIYNSSLGSTSFYQKRPNFTVIASGNGIGLSINF